jgi:hypothetical protein
MRKVQVMKLSVRESVGFYVVSILITLFKTVQENSHIKTIITYVIGVFNEALDCRLCCSFFFPRFS